MRATAPTPERMQSCLARTVAVARCCGSMQAREVASLVALSSSSAFSRMALILRLCQSIQFRLCLDSFLKNPLQLDHHQQQDHGNNGKGQLVRVEPVGLQRSRERKRIRKCPVNELTELNDR